MFLIKGPLTKLQAKNQNSTCTTFWTILLCTFKPYIEKIGWKLRVPIQCEQRLTDRQTGGQRMARISSPGYVKSGVKNMTIQPQSPHQRRWQTIPTHIFSLSTLRNKCRDGQP